MNIRTIEISGFNGAILGARNPMESWEKSDSYPGVIGEADMKLLHTLLSGGPEEHKFMRMIHVQAQVDMPRYFWSEADTYHFGTKNSCSTMHKLLNNKRPITCDLFTNCDEDLDVLKCVTERLEELRIKFRGTKDNQEKNYLLLRAKRLLPEGFLQMRMWDTNYAELRNMYFQRRHHRLKEEWIDTFCKWIETLPYANELIMYEPPKNEVTA